MGFCFLCVCTASIPNTATCILTQHECVHGACESFGPVRSPWHTDVEMCVHVKLTLRIPSLRQPYNDRRSWHYKVQCLCMCAYMRVCVCVCKRARAWIAVLYVERSFFLTGWRLVKYSQSNNTSDIIRCVHWCRIFRHHQLKPTG